MRNQEQDIERHISSEKEKSSCEEITQTEEKKI